MGPVIIHRRLIVGLVVGLMLLSCNLPGLAPTPTPQPTLTPVPSLTPPPTPEPADTGWETVEPGVELRQLFVPTGDVAEKLTIVRLDPALFSFRVRYMPGSGWLLSEWAAVEANRSNAVLVVNGGYFTPDNMATGLVVSDGQVYGTPYGDYAGMFAVLPGGRVQVRWLAAQPYEPGEMVVEAVQSFPVLIKPGGVMGFPADADDGTPSRRTVVAQDMEGRILFISAPRGYLSLHQVAVFLAGSDLGVDVALNLDGGQSTGLYLTAGEIIVQQDSLVPVPSVIVVERHG